jgi:hypothetical protein
MTDEEVHTGINTSKPETAPKPLVSTTRFSLDLLGTHIDLSSLTTIEPYHAITKR